MSFRQFMCFFFFFSNLQIVSKWQPGSRGEQEQQGENVQFPEIFLKFFMTKISTVVMKNFKDIKCRIVNNHGRMSCQTGVRESIFRFCRCIYNDTGSIYVY